MREIGAGAPVHRLRFETHGVTAWDSGLLTFLWELVEEGRRRGFDLDQTGLPPGVQCLLSLASRIASRICGPSGDSSASVTGISMEFQFGTNWAGFAEFAGGVIGQTLAVEGVFAFFLESAFLGVMLAGEGRVGARLHWVATLLVFLGSWLSGYFILATNAWMQHPVGYALAADHTVRLTSFFSLLGNPWLLWQYTHNQCGAATTGSFVVAGVGAYYLLAGKHPEQGRQFLRTALVVTATANVLLLYPTGDGVLYEDENGVKMAFAFFIDVGLGGKR